MKRALRKLAAILLLSAVLGALNAWLNPHTPPWNPQELLEGEIAVAGLSDLTNPAYIDARSRSEFASGHIPGAFLLNEDAWVVLLFEFIESWDPGQIIVVYCSSLECQASHSVAERLKEELGFGEIFVLKGGWESWLEHNQ